VWCFVMALLSLQTLSLILISIRHRCSDLYRASFGGGKVWILLSLFPLAFMIMQIDLNTKES
jgi:hypothetical protein